MREEIPSSRWNPAKDVLLAISAIALAIIAISSIYFQVRVISIASESMAPTLRTDDMALTIQAPLDSISEGDVVVLPHPSDTSLQFAHRLVKVDRKGGRVVVQTKGDANPVKDSWVLALGGEKVPKVVFSLATSRLPLGGEGRIRLGQVFFLGALLVLIFSLARRESDEVG